jgi:hypothetical protein
MHTTTCLTWPLLEVGRTVTWSPSKPSTRLHTTRFGFTGERAMTTSPGLTFSNLDDKCSNSNMSPETLNVGSMLGPKHNKFQVFFAALAADAIFASTVRLRSFHSMPRWWRQKRQVSKPSKQCWLNPLSSKECNCSGSVIPTPTGELQQHGWRTHWESKWTVWRP